MRVALRLQPDDNACNRARRVAGIAELYVGEHQKECFTPEVQFVARASERVSLLVRGGVRNVEVHGAILYIIGGERVLLVRS